MAYTLPELGFAHDALEPHIDATTMEIHHSKHHQTYVDKLNGALEGVDVSDKSVEALLADLSVIPDDKKQAIINHGGGHANHSLFWRTLAPGGASAPSGDLAAAIDSAFGSFDELKTTFEATGAAQFGSGWAWLCSDGGKLSVGSTGNQDSPIMSGSCPILGCDVWEHAYYLNYQNKRPAYLSAFWNVVNWDVVGENYGKSQG
ncbi:MAG: superoxide dismutase [Candidatus Hydrogenedentota bacterium]